MQSYYVWTVGCQMNKADSDRLESALGQMGLDPKDAPKDADVIVLNSCVVRESAEDRVVGMLTSLKPVKQQDPDKVIALMGCMVGPQTSRLTERYPYVDLFMPPQKFGPLIDLLGERMGIDPEGCIGLLTASADIATYVPIIHGCNKFCTFCIIPYRRGREVSRPLAEIVGEVQGLARRGVREVTLLGQNVDSYGHDLDGNTDLGDLLSAVNDVEELDRVRFLTSHPNDMSDHIIDKIAGLDKVCEHVNLPFQAGDDTVLESMRRGYTNEQYRKLVDKIRDRIPGVSLATDLIVGFCGESQEQFERTVELVRDIRFDKVHSAVYSTRPGTIASRGMQDDVLPEEKQRRFRVIEQLQEQVVTEINADLAGTRQEVLVEGRRRGRWFGRTRNDKLVFFDDDRDRRGELVEVLVDQTGPWSLRGTLVESGRLATTAVASAD
ncbi:MAG: tRNA (N6-isopentenyl adenosine(37)-C2)-methylthiotransferase MiaB [SAR202 cluster bacterium]|jgi:tRNA-2-methylthio-N6-dimethylallyladenosine synthase|nr:tRNA (N6-isopentenyl adenosine(37)-C2)-methylthiotransferase MiaB [SAR202 cluster bacterium]MDP6665510.1 tRNA (N6-isopentenyl adenosine(37)-C2)-methylthiotransferase MiaB [SAR202 cluster bacterium]MDP6798304.1 tRNA (N6-isopentenyl adenosine(37)-C2)-methylthiotransferase MiaB [SAR202 cluster bacterium]